MTQDHLVLDFPINGPANAKALADELPPLMPASGKGSGQPGTVHFSRFMIKGDEKNSSSFRTLTARRLSMLSGLWKAPPQCLT